jgi:hypothetical protein
MAQEDLSVLVRFVPEAKNGVKQKDQDRPANSLFFGSAWVGDVRHIFKGVRRAG